VGGSGQAPGAGRDPADGHDAAGARGSGNPGGRVGARAGGSPSEGPRDLEGLLRRPGLWRGSRGWPEQEGDTLPTGFPALDAVLPGGGWPAAALVEILAPAPGIGELGLLFPALARLAAAGRMVAWVAPPHPPHAPELWRRGLAPERCLVVRPRRSGEARWAAEQALRSGVCGAVLLWLEEEEPGLRALRRLQLAAQVGSSLGVLHRSPARAASPSPAILRLRLHAGNDGSPGGVEVIKCRGRPPGRVLRLDLP
jgi:hypothetical protein